MGIIDKLSDEKTWQDFLEYKRSKQLLSREELEYFEQYIGNKKYEDIIRKIQLGNYVFSNPTKLLVNKINRSKKRIVYTFNEDETMVLKCICYLLYSYDSQLSQNCYSFRKEYGVKQAIFSLMGHHKTDKMYCYKIDIRNYFNSIPIDKLLPILKEYIKDDEKLYNFLAEILTNNKAQFQGNIIEEQKGVMAGTPISPFLANIYLQQMDEYFYTNKIIYARYSDDVIIFGEKDKIDEYIKKLKQYICDYRLEINEDKEEFIEPKGRWNFLGFSYENGKVDLSDITKEKIKGKIKRAARKIRRWKLKKDASDERALKTMNKKFNRKFYEYNGRDLTWGRWFFPIINTSDGLKEIDMYMQEYLRYMVTGKFNKKNYEKVPYELLKQYNYRPLVHEYYTYKENVIENDKENK